LSLFGSFEKKVFVKIGYIGGGSGGLKVIMD